MADTQKKELRRSPLAMQLLKGAFFLFIGFVLIVQPWLRAVAWVGWIIMVLSALIGCAALLRLRNAHRMQKQLIAEFENGDAVYEHGLRIDGALYDFSTYGAQLDAAGFDGEKLSFRYSFYARRGGRTGETVTIAVAAEEADKAQVVLERLGLPAIVDAREAEESRTP